MEDKKDNQDMEFKETKDQASSVPVNITVSGENAGDGFKNEPPESRIVDAPALILSGIVVFPHALTPLVLNDPGLGRIVSEPVAGILPGDGDIDR